MKRTKSIYLALLVMLSPMAAIAGPIVDGSHIIGFSGLDIGGTLYDVEFVEGTCASVWDGCDEDSDFFWQNEEDAEAAMDALLAGVLAASYSFNVSELAYGCGAEGGCYMYTAYYDDVAHYWAVYNYDVGSGASFSAGGGDNLLTADSAEYENAVNVRWSLTPVPEPGTLTLLGLGLVGMAARRRKKV